MADTKQLANKGYPQDLALCTVDGVTLEGDGSSLNPLKVIGGAVIGGHAQVFTYTATGAEGTDFHVPLPAARASTSYLIQYAQGDAAFILGFHFPNGPGDRTTTQFRVVASAPVTAGDTLMFLVEDQS